MQHSEMRKTVKTLECTTKSYKRFGTSNGESIIEGIDAQINKEKEDEIDDLTATDKSTVVID